MMTFVRKEKDRYAFFNDSGMFFILNCSHLVFVHYIVQKIIKDAETKTNDIVTKSGFKYFQDWLRGMGFYVCS